MVLLWCRLLVTNSSASVPQVGQLMYDIVNVSSRGSLIQCGTCLCQSTSATTGSEAVTLTQCSFKEGTHELLIKKIQHSRVEMSKMITGFKNSKRLTLTIEDTQIQYIEDLSQRMFHNIQKIILRQNPQLLLVSSSFISLPEVFEVHQKGFQEIDLASFSFKALFFNGVDLGEIRLKFNTKWGMLKTKKLYISGNTVGFPPFMQASNIERMEIVNVQLMDNQVPLEYKFLRGATSIRSLAIRNSPSVVLPKHWIERLNLTHKLALTLDLPNIEQFSLKNLRMVKSINGVRVINRHKWRTPVEADCQYFCGDPIVDASKIRTLPECLQKKNTQTFICALCLRNKLEDNADFERTRNICGYNSKKSPDYSYDYGFNEATEQSPDFYNSPQNLVHLSFSTIIVIILHSSSIVCAHSSVTTNIQ